LNCNHQGRKGKRGEKIKVKIQIERKNKGKGKEERKKGAFTHSKEIGPLTRPDAPHRQKQNTDPRSSKTPSARMGPGH
jgi:hypothetical protein